MPPHVRIHIHCQKMQRTTRSRMINTGWTWVLFGLKMGKKLGQLELASSYTDLAVFTLTLLDESSSQV